MLTPGPKLGAASTRWHIHVNGQTYGPYTAQQIQQMIEQHRIVGSDLVYPEGGSKWQKITSDHTLGALFKRSIQPPRRQQRKSSLLKWVLGAAVIVISGWASWPYYALYDLAVGANTGDTSILEARVDWTSLREGLRDDLNAMFLQSMKAQADNQKNDSEGAALGQGLAVMLGPVIIDRMVDAYVTPQAIAAEIRSGEASAAPPTAAAQDTPGVRSTVPVDNAKGLTEPVRRIRQSELQYAFFSGSPFVFLVEVKPRSGVESQQPVGLRFQWEGTWKLARVILPPDLISGVAAAAKANSAQGLPGMSR
jgi:hypothetical protein